ncbi:microfibril-associated glycoprotein 4-like [Gigantopelta aegis]|uniref:microfibril-associated glycoprotein 4-like n=1 Tax=Gigantopelta aegis TaxID=1735272 RepID=UPI001B88E037|nr:microfibril-associated glycoprotein 4-like [Gigantopelta aegis]
MATSIFLMLSIFNRTQLTRLAILLSIIGVPAANICGDKTFRIAPLYSHLKPVERPAKELNVSSRMACSTTCYYNVKCTGFFYNDNGRRCSMFNVRFHSLSFVNETGTQAYEVVSGVPSDCYDVMQKGDGTGAVYTIVPRDNGAPINVSCEEEGWLVIQRRTDGSEDFYRTWNEYRYGFGDLNNEFWLGNTNIHRITSQGHYDLRIDLEDFEGNTRYALYKNFSVASKQDYFRLSVGEYSGDAGDGLGNHSGYRFSARDLDLDAYKSNCAQMFKGAWWYKSCHSSNLNGQYLGASQKSYADGVDWSSWRGHYYSMKTSVMKIRPMKF